MMNNQRIEKIRAFLNQPDDVYEEAPVIALELLEVVDELQSRILMLSAGMAVIRDEARSRLTPDCLNSDPTATAYRKLDRIALVADTSLVDQTG